MSPPPPPQIPSGRVTYCRLDEMKPRRLNKEAVYVRSSLGLGLFGYFFIEGRVVLAETDYLLT